MNDDDDDMTSSGRYQLIWNLQYGEGLDFPTFTIFGLYQMDWKGMWKKYLLDTVILNLEPLT
jgi:hypothetical protein